MATYGGRIYYAGGLDPYNKVSTPWFSVYDPATDRWSELHDMPRARDHFGAAIVDGKLYAIGGRHVVRENPVVENDAYDLATGKWITGLAPLPGERSGTATAVLGDEILVLGGERIWTQPAKRTVEAYHPATDTWRSLPDMAIGAHGIQAAVCNGGVYVAAGATSPGAKDPSTFFQVYFPGPVTPCGRDPAGRRARRPRSCRRCGGPTSEATPTPSTARCEEHPGRGGSLLAVCFAAVAGLMALPACEPVTHHHQYVVSQLKPTALRIYDMDDGHRLLRTVPLPQLVGKVAGMAGSAVTDRLYLTSTGDEAGGVLLAYDLRTNTRRLDAHLHAGRGLALRRRPTAPSCTCRAASTPRASTSSSSTRRTATSSAPCPSVPPRPTTRCATLDGTRAYLSSIRTPYLTVADTSDDHVIRRVGPFGDSIRPFTINGRNTLAIVNVNRLIGFEVGDIATGREALAGDDPRLPLRRQHAQPEPRRRPHPGRAGGVGGRLPEQEVARVRRDRAPRCEADQGRHHLADDEPVLDHLQPRRPLRVPRHRRRDRHHDTEEGLHDRQPGVQAGAGRPARPATRCGSARATASGM